MARTLYFISHPDVEINPNIPVTNWSLSVKGYDRFKQLLQKPWIQSLSAIYCSGEQKAIDGAVMLSGATGLSYTILASLGENDRSSTGYLPGPEFEETADQFFSSPDSSVRGWETATAAQRRIVDAIALVDSEVSGSEPVGVVSHGAVGTLLYCYINNEAINRCWDQPGAGGGNYMVVNTGSVPSCSWWLPYD